MNIFVVQVKVNPCTHTCKASIVALQRHLLAKKILLPWPWPKPKALCRSQKLARITCCSVQRLKIVSFLLKHLLCIAISPFLSDIYQFPPKLICLTIRQKCSPPAISQSLLLCGWGPISPPPPHPQTTLQLSQHPTLPPTQPKKKGY